MTENWRGRERYDISLAPYTSWQVGGPARRLYEPVDQLDLSHYLKQLPADEPILWLGLGSNTLIRDGGFPGTVILTLGALKEISPVSEDVVRAEVGVASPTLARHMARMGLVGLEFLAGVPGTIGGALRMNAGAFGGETWNHVVLVETVDRQGNIHYRKPEEFHVRYRHVQGPGEEWFIAGHFKADLGDKQVSLGKIKGLLEARASSQPTGQPSCGSVFRNPPGDYAGRLIESTGLKGLKEGGAYVSEKHANFIINDGNATAKQIETLIESVAQRVYEKHGVHLEREVLIVGEFLRA